MAGPSSAPQAKTGSGLIWTGVILLVVGIIGGSLMVVLGFARLGSSLAGAPEMSVPGSQNMHLTAGQYVLYDRGNLTESDVTITGPSGEKLTPRFTKADQNFHRDGRRYTSFASFTAATAGNYQFDVRPRSSTSSATNEMIIGPDALAVVGGTVGLVFGGFGCGGLFLVLGLILLIVGLVQRSRSKRPPVAPMGPYGMAPPGPYGAPPPGPAPPGPYGAPPPGPPPPGAPPPW